MAEHWLQDRLSSFADADAFLGPSGSFTYRQLQETQETFREKLITAGVKAGDGVAIIADFSPEASALLVALVLHRTILIPLSPTLGDVMPEFLDIARPHWVIDLRDGFSLERRDVPSRHELLDELAARGEAGLILFSSGSTGKSKASLLSFDRLLEKSKKPGKSFRTLAFLLLDHIGGLNTLFSVLSSGGAVVSVAQRGVETVAEAIAKHRVQLLPTTPTFLKMMLMADAHLRYDLSSLTYITYGTEPMPDSTLKALHAAFPEVRLKQTYGLSELGILRSQSKEPDSLWVRVGGEGVETKVVDNVLWIRTRSAMLGYLNAPSPFDDDGWFNTQDVVEVDGDYLRILGRATEIINVGGEKVYPAEVENALMQATNVRDATVVGKKNPITGQIVVAQVSLHEPEEAREAGRRLREHCLQRLAPYQVPMLIQVVDELSYSDRFKKMRRAAVT